MADVKIEIKMEHDVAEIKVERDIKMEDDMPSTSRAVIKTEPQVGGSKMTDTQIDDLIDQVFEKRRLGGRATISPSDYAELVQKLRDYDNARENGTGVPNQTAAEYLNEHLENTHYGARNSTSFGESERRSVKDRPPTPFNFNNKKLDDDDMDDDSDDDDVDESLDRALATIVHDCKVHEMAGTQIPDDIYIDPDEAIELVPIGKSGAYMLAAKTFYTEEQVVEKTRESLKFGRSRKFYHPATRIKSNDLMPGRVKKRRNLLASLNRAASASTSRARASAASTSTPCRRSLRIRKALRTSLLAKLN